MSSNFLVSFVSILSPPDLALSLAPFTHLNLLSNVIHPANSRAISLLIHLFVGPSVSVSINLYVRLSDRPSVQPLFPIHLYRNFQITFQVSNAMNECKLLLDYVWVLDSYKTNLGIVWPIGLAPSLTSIPPHACHTFSRQFFSIS